MAAVTYQKFKNEGAAYHQMAKLGNWEKDAIRYRMTGWSKKDIYYILTTKGYDVTRDKVSKYLDAHKAETEKDYKESRKIIRLEGVNHKTRYAGEMYRLTGEKSYWEIIEEGTDLADELEEY